MGNRGSRLRRLLTPAPTFSRYRYLAGKIDRYSVTRLLQYEALENYPLVGDVLDFGGGEKSDYRKLLKCTSYQSVNIDPKIEPTWLVNVGEPLPCETASFDTAISLNTLEHIFDAQSALAELYRVLLTGRRVGVVCSLSVPGAWPPGRLFSSDSELVSTGALNVRFQRNRRHAFGLGTFFHRVNLFRCSRAGQGCAKANGFAA